jgi:hypothetical protein
MWHVWKKGEVHRGLWWGHLMERGHLEDAGVDGRLILNWISTTWIGVMDWTDLADDNDKWQVLVRAVMNILFPQNEGYVLTI